MRMFRRADAPPQGPDDYGCQDDGMVGLGCGARSYTAALHYSFDYAVGMRRGPRRSSTTTRPPRTSAAPRSAGTSTSDEARRRYCCSRCSRPRACRSTDYRRAVRRRTRATDFPAELDRFAGARLAGRTTAAGLLRLTAEGLAHSDAHRARALLPRRTGRDGRVRAEVTARHGPDDPLPRPAGHLQLRLPVLPVRQAARQPRSSCAPTGRRWSGSPPGRAAQTGDRLSVLFTPWGEGLVRSWYRRALVELSQLPHVDRVAIQTNLSCRTGLAGRRRPATRSPCGAPTTRARPRTSASSASAGELAGLGVRFSVGVVGLPEHLERGPPAARRRCPTQVYLWVNAAEGHTYTDAEADRVDGARPALPVQPPPAPLGRAAPAGPASRSSRWTATARCGAATSSRPSWATSTTAPTARALAPARLPARRLRLPHRLRPPGDAAAVRRLRGRRPGARADDGGTTGKEQESE